RALPMWLVGARGAPSSRRLSPDRCASAWPDPPTCAWPALWPQSSIARSCRRRCGGARCAATSSFEALQVVLGEDAIRKIAQLHVAVLQRRALVGVQRIVHDDPHRPHRARRALEVLVARALEEAVGERVELG